MKKNENEYSIIVNDVYKRFKLVYDKPFTLKERLIFWKNTKVGYNEVLKVIKDHYNNDYNLNDYVINLNGHGCLLLANNLNTLKEKRFITRHLPEQLKEEK